MMLCSVSTSVLDDPEYLSPAQMSQLEDESIRITCRI